METCRPSVYLVYGFQTLCWTCIYFTRWTIHLILWTLQNPCEVETPHPSTPFISVSVCPMGERLHSRYKSVICIGCTGGTNHLWLWSLCIAGQTENPLIKIPSSHKEALKSKHVLEICELQSQSGVGIILLTMGEGLYNTLRRPETAEVIPKKKKKKKSLPHSAALVWEHVQDVSSLLCSPEPVQSCKQQGVFSAAWNRSEKSASLQKNITLITV